MPEGKDERRISNILIPIASIIASAVVAIIIAAWNSAELQEQFRQSLARQDESNRIMNESLNTQLESLQKKSNIQVIVSPESGVLKVEQQTASWLVSDKNGTYFQEFQDTGYALSKLGLVRNSTATFSISIANVGSNIARIDHVVATIVPIEQNETLKILTLDREPIGQILAPDGQPHNFKYSFPVKEEYSPAGKIVFQIFYKSDKREYSYDYEYLG